MHEVAAADEGEADAAPARATMAATSSVHHFLSILLAFPVPAILYQRFQWTIVSSGFRLAGLKSVPSV